VQPTCKKHASTVLFQNKKQAANLSSSEKWPRKQ